MTTPSGKVERYEESDAYKYEMAAFVKNTQPMTTQNSWIEFNDSHPTAHDMPIAIARISNGEIFSTCALRDPASVTLKLLDGYTHWTALPEAPKPPESAEFLAGREAVLSELRALVGRYNSSTLLVGDMSEAEFIHAVAEMVK